MDGTVTGGSWPTRNAADNSVPDVATTSTASPSGTGRAPASRGSGRGSSGPKGFFGGQHLHHAQRGSRGPFEGACAPGVAWQGFLTCAQQLLLVLETGAEQVRVAHAGGPMRVPHIIEQYGNVP